MNDLVVPQEGPSALAGAGAFSNLEAMATSVLSDPAQTSFNVVAAESVGLAVDALGAIEDPFKWVIACGVGWLLEHVDWLREPLELLTGDPAAVKAAAQSYDRVSDYLAQTLTEHNNALRRVTAADGWDGDAADAFRSASEQCGKSIEALMPEAKNCADVAGLAGGLVGTVKALVFNLIADLLSILIKHAILAAASAFFTCGASMAAFLADVAIMAGLTGSQIWSDMMVLSAKLSQFAKTCQKSFDLLQPLSSALKEAATLGLNAPTLQKGAGAMSSGASNAHSSRAGRHEPTDDSGETPSAFEFPYGQ